MPSNPQCTMYTSLSRNLCFVVLAAVVVVLMKPKLKCIHAKQIGLEYSKAADEANQKQQRKKTTNNIVSLHRPMKKEIRIDFSYYHLLYIWYGVVGLWG